MRERSRRVSLKDQPSFIRTEDTGLSLPAEFVAVLLETSSEIMRLRIEGKLILHYSGDRLPGGFQHFHGVSDRFRAPVHSGVRW